MLHPQLKKVATITTFSIYLYTILCGYMYQASNFRYLGHFTTSVYRDSATGEKIHPRSAGQLLAENAALEGVKKKCWLTYDFCAAKGIEKINGRMFRYIYPLTVEAKNILNSYPQYTGLPRPKDKDLYFAVRTGQRQYTQIAQPRFNRDICRYNPQKYGQAERR